MSSIVSKEKKNPLVTVVTAVYNRVLDIEKTILSIINQTYNKVQFIIIDGGSTDGTLDIIKKYEKNIDIWLSEQDRGVYDAMNKGIKLAKGEWINFMNAGDSFANEEVIENIFKENDFNNYGVIYGDAFIKTDFKKFYAKCTEPFFLSKKYCVGKGICHQSVFVKKSLASKYKFDLDYKISADYKMLSEIYKSGQDFFYFNNAIANYWIEDGLSKKNQITAWKEDAKIIGIDKTNKFKLWLILSLLRHYLRRNISKIIKLLFPNSHSSLREKRYKILKNN